MKGRIPKSVKAQPRLIAAVVLGTLLCFILPVQGATRLLVAWDCATALYLVLAFGMIAYSNIDDIRARAALHDEGQIVILGLTTTTAIVSLAGIMVELATAKTLRNHHGWQHIALAGITVVLSWTFLHTIFAVHYAHEYYAGGEGGLDFPGGEPPDYWDFMYYSFVIGAACATADINITSKSIRRTTMLHCIVAFFSTRPFSH